MDGRVGTAEWAEVAVEPSVGDTARTPGGCLNCGAPLLGDFCARCGQKAQAYDPTVADFLHDFSHEMLHFDGKIFRTVGALLFKPGRLTKDYFEGRRARWVSPIRLYLVCSVAYFAFAALDDDAPEGGDYGNRLMFVLVPLFAWLISIVARKRMNFPKHLSFSLHLHAVWFAAFLVREVGGSVLSPRFMNSTRWLGETILVYLSVYAILAFRHAYEEPFWKSALKMLGVVTAYGAAILLVLLGLAALHPTA